MTNTIYPGTMMERLKQPRDYWLSIAEHHGLKDQLLVYAERYGSEDDIIGPWLVGKLSVMLDAKEQ